MIHWLQHSEVLPSLGQAAETRETGLRETFPNVAILGFTKQAPALVHHRVYKSWRLIQGTFPFHSPRHKAFEQPLLTIT